MGGCFVREDIVAHICYQPAGRKALERQKWSDAQIYKKIPSQELVLISCLCLIDCNVSQYEYKTS